MTATNTEELRALQEIRQRTTRIESRICRIADFLGARVGNPSTELKITGVGEKGANIDTPVLDVTLSEIVQFLTANGIADKVAYIHFNGRLIATVTA